MQAIMNKYSPDVTTGQDRTWGPSHSEDQSEITDLTWPPNLHASKFFTNFHCGADSTWTAFEDSACFSSCTPVNASCGEEKYGSTGHSGTCDIRGGRQDPTNIVTDNVALQSQLGRSEAPSKSTGAKSKPQEGTAATTVSNKSKTADKGHGRSGSSSQSDDWMSRSDTGFMTRDITTLTYGDTTEGSFTQFTGDQTTYTPPRIENTARANSQRGGKPWIVKEPSFLDDMETRDSADVLDASERGFFFGLFDHICSPVIKVAKEKEQSFSKKMDEVMLGSVVFSLDDNFSKFATDDEHKSNQAYSLGDDSLSKFTFENDAKSVLESPISTPDTFDRSKKLKMHRATIAAIISAQEKTDAQLRAEERAASLAKADAEAFAHQGLEQTLTESPQLSDDDLSVGEDWHEDIQAVKFDDFAWEEFKPGFDSEFSSPENALEDEEFKVESDLLEVKESQQSKKGRKNRFLRPFHKLKKKSHSLRSAMTSKTNKWMSATRTPPHSPSQPSQKVHRSPVSVLDPTVSGAFDDPQHQEGRGGMSSHDSDLPELDLAEECREINGFAPRPSSFKMVPSVLEELEVLPKRKEPVYTTYSTRNRSQIMEGVEVLRKESDDTPIPPGKDMDEKTVVEGNESLTPVKSAMEDEPGKIVSFADIINLVSPKEVKEEEQPPALLVELSKESDVSMVDRDRRLEDITVRLAKETEESEKIREMLHQKDQDLEQLQQLLSKYEFKSIMEEIGRSSDGSKEAIDRESF